MITGVNGPRATFEVQEVWKGDVEPIAAVLGARDDGTFAEDDREWTLGMRYLVMPTPNGGVLRDSICSATTEWHDALGALRPRAAAPAVAETSGLSLAGTLAVLGVSILLAFFAARAWLAFRRPPT